MLTTAAVEFEEEEASMAVEVDEEEASMAVERHVSILYVYPPIFEIDRRIYICAKIGFDNTLLLVGCLKDS
jgi:hypothetical protein